jgi:hypothetical protein
MKRWNWFASGKVRKKKRMQIAFSTGRAEL